MAFLHMKTAWETYHFRFDCHFWNANCFANNFHNFNIEHKELNVKMFVKFNWHQIVTQRIPSILIPVFFSFNIIVLIFSLHSESGWKIVPSLSSFRSPLNRKRKKSKYQCITGTCVCFISTVGCCRIEGNEDIFLYYSNCISYMTRQLSNRIFGLIFLNVWYSPVIACLRFKWFVCFVVGCLMPAAIRLLWRQSKYMSSHFGWLALPCSLSFSLLFLSSLAPFMIVLLNLQQCSNSAMIHWLESI